MSRVRCAVCYLTYEQIEYVGCYFRELFLMFAGAICLAFNVAPTEKILLVDLKMTAWHAIAMGSFSLIVMQAFIFMAKFRGQESILEESSQLSVFLRITIPGYAIALLQSTTALQLLLHLARRLGR